MIRNVTGSFQYDLFILSFIINDLFSIHIGWLFPKNEQGNSIFLKDYLTKISHIYIYLRGKYLFILIPAAITIQVAYIW